MNVLDRLAAITWPEDTYTVTYPDGTTETYRIRGIPTGHPDYIHYVYAPWYDEDAGTLADATDLIIAEAKGLNLTRDRAERIAKALGLARRPAPLPDTERISRSIAAHIIMGTLDEDGGNAFGWAPGKGIPKAQAERLRSLLPANALGDWMVAISDLTPKTTRQEVEAGKASSDDEETSEPSTT